MEFEYSHCRVDITDSSSCLHLTDTDFIRAITRSRAGSAVSLRNAVLMQALQH